MPSASRAFTVAVLVAGACLTASPAAAQGKGHGNAFGHGKKGSGGVTTGPSGSVAATSGSEEGPAAVRTFGSWLDDASVVTPGTGFASLSIGYWRTPGFTEIDVPAFDVGVGLTPRVQVGASVPFYHARPEGGPVVRGLGDFCFSTKVQLREPGASRVGLAVIPVLEVMSSAPEPGASRASWALPVAIELQRDSWRAYSSVGYFSRGAVFASGALELAMSERAWVTGTISQSRSTSGPDGADPSGLAKTRTDVSGGVTYALSNTIGVSGTIGRTLSSVDPSRTTLVLSGGLSVALSR